MTGVGKMIEFIKRNKVSVFMVAAVLTYISLGAGVRLWRTYQFRGEWAQFDSIEHSKADTFPDGFRLDYPASWNVLIYENGGTKNLRELRSAFTKPNYIFVANTYLNIWWRRVDESWTLEDARQWYVQELAFGIRDSELEQKQTSFQEQTVGVGNYPALIQTFDEFGGKNPHRQVVLLVVDDEAFALSFHTKTYDEEIQKTFERILNSLEIYR
jgi:hypothetical protein